MDKQLIERIALEVAEAMPEGFLLSEGCGYEVGVVKSEVRNFAHAFLARIDAERGKGAVAFRMIDGDDVEYNAIDQFSCGRTGGEPLFLSPTITEGMVLVHAAPNKAAFIGGFSFNIEETCSACSLHGAQEDCEVCGGEVTYSRQVTVPWATIKEIHRAMLATAQGEK